MNTYKDIAKPVNNIVSLLKRELGSISFALNNRNHYPNITDWTGIEVKRNCIQSTIATLTSEDFEENLDTLISLDKVTFYKQNS